MQSSNPYKDMSTEDIIKQTDLLKSAIYDSQPMLSILLHLSSSPDATIASKARVAYNSLLELKDQAITAKAFANQQLIVNYEEMDK